MPAGASSKETGSRPWAFDIAFDRFCLGYARPQSEGLGTAGHTDPCEGRVSTERNRLFACYLLPNGYAPETFLFPTRGKGFGCTMYRWIWDVSFSKAIMFPKQFWGRWQSSVTQSAGRLLSETE